MEWVIEKFPWGQGRGTLFKFQGEAFLRIDFKLDKSSGIRMVDVLGSSMGRREGNSFLLSTYCMPRRNGSDRTAQELGIRSF